MSQINMMSKISIIGCGYTGSSIAINFANIGYQIDIIDNNYNSFIKLPENLVSEGYLNPIIADATKASELKKITDPECKACIILSGKDSINALIAQIFKKEFNISTIICRINEKITSELYSSFGFITLSQADLLKHKILDLFEKN